jgi:hypothetical protein
LYGYKTNPLTNVAATEVHSTFLSLTSKRKRRAIRIIAQRPLIKGVLSAIGDTELLAILRNPAGGQQATTISPPEVKAMTDNRADLDPSTWDPALDAVIAAPKHHKVLFENERLRVLEVTLEPNDEEPVHHHRWPSVFVFDQVQPPVHDFAPDGTQLPPNRDVIKAIDTWNGEGCLVVNMAPQPAGRVFNASQTTVHGIRVEMKTVQ